MEKARVELKDVIDNSYDILIDDGLFDRSASELKDKPLANVYVIITDNNVEKLHGKKLLKNLFLLSNSYTYILNYIL